MINEKVAELLNEQINGEIASGYIYLGMSNYLIDLGLDGYGHWFKLQAQEELEHARMMMDYLQDNDRKISLADIKAPSVEYKNVKEVLDHFLSHEEDITASINNIYKVALDNVDFRSQKFLDWFIEEQGEEETNAITMIGKYELFGNSDQGLYQLDREYSTRVLEAASTEE